MFPYYHLEEIAYTRHQEFLQQARRRRLINSLRHQPAKRRRLSPQVTIWAGAQLIRWGLKLQGYRPASLRTATLNSSDDFYGKEFWLDDGNWINAPERYAPLAGLAKRRYAAPPALQR